MAYQVTATEGANAVNGVLLRIKVLTGAATVQTGATKIADTSTTPFYNQSITTTQAGSIVYGAMADGNDNLTFTAGTLTTLLDNFGDAVQGCQYSSFRATSATGTPGATTLGASAPASGTDHGTYAAAEILAAGTIAEDASSPAVATTTAATAVTSASFTPPAGSLLVAMVAHCSSGVSTITITNSGGTLTWTKLAYESTAAGTGSGVWIAQVPSGVIHPPLPLQAAPLKLAPPFWAPAQVILAPTAQGSPVALSGTGTLAGAPVASLTGLATLSGSGTLAASASGPFAPVTRPPVQPPAPPAPPRPRIIAALLPPAPPVIAGLGGVPGAGWFTDQHGNPRMVLGDAVWGLPGNAGRWSSGAWAADFDTYFATRGGQGFTVAYTKPMGTTQSGNIDDEGGTFDGLFPFQGGSGANPSTGLTAAYWARIDYMLSSALAQGITVFFNAIGYNSDFNGGPGPLAGKSTTEFQSYGAQLGARYAGRPNLVWNLADDYFGGDDSVISAFLTGVRGAGDTHAVSIENYPETTSREDLSTAAALPWGTSNGQYNFCYSYNVTYYGVELAFLESSPLPVIQGDGYFYQGNSSYEGGSGAFAYDRAIRQDAWMAVSSGARGFIVGDEACWQWPSGAQSSAAANWYQVHNAGNIRTLIESLPDWQLLIPDTSSVLVTAGRGTHASGFTSGGGGGQYEVAFTDSYVTASRTPSGDLAVIYLSHGSTITIDQTQMVSGYAAFWVDPITGAKTSATAGTTYNSTAKGNNSQGDPDWVLVLQAGAGVTRSAVITPVTQPAAPQPPRASRIAGAPAAATLPGSATLSGSGSLAAAPVFTAAAALSGSGTLAGAPVLAATAGLSGSGTLTGSPAFTAAATLSGTGSLAAAPSLAAGATMTGTGTLGAVTAVANGPLIIQAAAQPAAPRGPPAPQITGAPPGAVLPAAATLTGSGTLAAGPYFGAAAVLTGSGTLSAAPILTATASLTGAGTLSAAPGLAGTAGLSGSGTLTGAPGLAGAAALSGTGTLAAVPTAPAQATLTGLGTLSAAPALTAAASLSGTGTLGAAPSLTVTPGLSGTGTLTGAPALTAAGALSGSGTLAAASAAPASAALSGSGTLAAAGALTPAGTLSGSGTLNGSPVRTAAAVLSGLGTLTGSPARAVPGSAQLSGTGTLSAAPAGTKGGSQAMFAAFP